MQPYIEHHYTELTVNSTDTLAHLVSTLQSTNIDYHVHGNTLYGCTHADIVTLQEMAWPPLAMECIFIRDVLTDRG